MAMNPQTVSERPPWLAQPQWQGVSSHELERTADDATPPQISVAAVLELLEERGGWDGTLAPEDSWERLVGIHCPYPGDAEFCHHATYGPLDRLLADETITDVHLNGPGRDVLVRRSNSEGEWHIGEVWHDDWFPWLISQFEQRGTGSCSGLQISGTVDVARPGRLPCVLRYEIVRPLLCPQGPALSLRFLRSARQSLGRLAEQRMLPSAMASFLAGCMEAGISIALIGSPGTGKTTLARALLSLPTIADSRLICIEDVPELAITNPHAVQLVARAHTTMLSLTYAALRMTPSRLVLGEVRGAEAYALLAAMRAGNPILTTLHGANASGGLDAFIGMALEAPEARSSVDLVRMNLNAQPLILVALRRQGARREVAELAEVLPTGGIAHPIAQTRWRRASNGDSWTLVSPPSDALMDRLRHTAHQLTLAELELGLGGDFR